MLFDYSCLTAAEKLRVVEWGWLETPNTTPNTHAYSLCLEYVCYDPGCLTRDASSHCATKLTFWLGGEADID